MGNLTTEEIAVVVPTIRPECLQSFLLRWRDTLKACNAKLLVVWDGEVPYVECDGKKYTIPTELDGTIFNLNSGVRNLGFYYAAKLFPRCQYIVTLDDDVSPLEDSISGHVNALRLKVPISWMSTASEYTRGFPYAVREEAEVYVSHGVWEGTKDYDAPTKLVKGNLPVTFYKGPVPKGVFIPVCGMNLAFRREALPYVYFAPMGNQLGVNRFDDIWMGITLKREFDALNKAMVTGFSTVHHDCKSDVFKNLQQEARGIALNETFWAGDKSDKYFEIYDACYARWKKEVNLVL
jgi:hypothetical protein